MKGLLLEFYFSVTHFPSSCPAVLCLRIVLSQRPADLCLLCHKGIITLGRQSSVTIITMVEYSYRRGHFENTLANLIEKASLHTHSKEERGSVQMRSRGKEQMLWCKLMLELVRGREEQCRREGQGRRVKGPRMKGLSDTGKGVKAWQAFPPLLTTCGDFIKHTLI